MTRYDGGWRALPDRLLGRSHLVDQLQRAAVSVVLHIAEGAGELSKLDRCRYYLSARGSATECTAVFDILVRLDIISPAAHAEAKQQLERIVSMRITLARGLEWRGPGGRARGSGNGTHLRSPRRPPATRASRDEKRSHEPRVRT
jgi:four helix bundle protein